jgi:hypothetical protein
MQLSDMTLLAFTACNSLRVFAYAPQILSAARDENGCAAVSLSTWGMFLIAHASAIAYACINVQDGYMAVIFTANALCCLAILAVVTSKRRRHRGYGGRADLHLPHGSCTQHCELDASTPSDDDQRHHHSLHLDGRQPRRRDADLYDVRLPFHSG